MARKYGDPGPIGYVCLGLTTLLANTHETGFTDLNSGILSMGIFVGGLTQLLAGVLEYWTGNTFGMTMFISYGLYWESLVGIWLLPKIFPGINAPDPTSFGIFMIVWCIFTLVLFVGSFKLNAVLSFVLGSLALLFLLLSIGKFTESLQVQKAAGWIGFICACSALYLGYSQLINEAYKKQIFPTFPFYKVQHAGFDDL